MQQLCNAQFYINALLSLFQCSAAMPTLESPVAKQACICGHLSADAGDPTVILDVFCRSVHFPVNAKSNRQQEPLLPTLITLWLQCFEDQQKGWSYHDHESEFILTILIHVIYLIIVSYFSAHMHFMRVCKKKIAYISYFSCLKEASLHHPSAVRPAVLASR